MALSAHLENWKSWLSLRERFVVKCLSLQAFCCLVTRTNRQKFYLFIYLFLQPSAASFAASIKFRIKTCHTHVSQLTVLLLSWHLSCPRTVWAYSQRNPLFIFSFENKQRQTNTIRTLLESSVEKSRVKGVSILLTTQQKAQFKF